MTVINSAILWGLAAISIPILIHLFNRRKAKVIDWGAMQFLMGSLVSRRRRVQIEEIIVLFLRCLLVALLVLAVARPLWNAGAPLIWLILLPVLVVAALLLAVATVMARDRRWRWLLYAAGAIVLVMAVFATQILESEQLQRWAKLGKQDLAIVIDGSTSMTIDDGGDTNFERAVEEARKLVETLGPGDTVSILVAGAAPELATPTPMSVHREASGVLDGLKPVGGSLSVVDALGAAAASLAEGDNAAKKIVLVTDGQDIGWDVENPARWEFLASTLDGLTTRPQVVCLRLGLPEAFHNAAVSGVELSRSVVGGDRPVAITVRVENTGGDPIEPEGVQLRVDGGEAQTLPIGTIEPGAAEQVRFKHRFTKGGAHVVRAGVLVGDDLPADDAMVRVVPTIESLPVLLIDGAASGIGFDSATALIEIALAPPSVEESEDGEGPLVATQVIAAPDLDDAVRFGEYQVVVLANVPRLSSGVAERLAEFVKSGGGLLVAPGDRSEPEFYNAWTAPGGRPLMPAKMTERATSAARAAKAAPDTFKHAALARLLAEGKSDIKDAAFTAYWLLDPDGGDSVQIGGSLDGGDPLLVERNLGKGRVVMTAVSLDLVGGNLPTLTAFLPMMHELVYNLASPAQVDLNVKPSALVKFHLPASGEPEADDTQINLTAELTGPDGRAQRVATLERQVDQWIATATGLAQPGLYRLKLPEGAAITLAAADTDDASAGLPVAVATDAAESRLKSTGEVETALAGKHTDFFLADSGDAARAVIAGDIPGREVWRWLAVAAVLVLLAESFITRWIVANRKTGTAETVDFTSEGERVSGFQARAREMVEAVRN